MNEYKLYLASAKKEQISTHFTLYDVSHSNTAIAKGIDNRPSPDIVANAKNLILNVLEPLRNHFNKPVIVNCMYRCPELNKVIGGVKNSQHVSGKAADIVVRGINLKDAFEYIKKNLIFDQVIYEGSWIHVSFVTGHNRKQSLKLVNNKYIAA